VVAGQQAFSAEQIKGTAAARVSILPMNKRRDVMMNLLFVCTAHGRDNTVQIVFSLLLDLFMFKLKRA
jgi:hypothetical protein